MDRNEQIVQDFQGGSTLEDLAHSYGLKEAYVRTILRSAGLELPSRKRGPKARTGPLTSLHRDVSSKMIVFRAGLQLEPYQLAAMIPMTTKGYKAIEAGGEMTLSQLGRIAEVMGKQVKDFL